MCPLISLSLLQGKVRTVGRDGPRDTLASLLVPDCSCGLVEEPDKRLSYHYLTNPFLAVPEFLVRFDTRCAANLFVIVL